MRKINKFKIFPRLFRIVISAAVMSMSVVVLKEFNIHLIANILLSAGIYFVALYILKDKAFMEVLSVFGKGYKKFLGE